MPYRSKSSRAGQGIARAVMRATDVTRAEALSRATTGQSFANYPAIIEGFIAKGIPVDDISPRENVFTYQAWKAKGRQVRKGEHGVRIATMVEMTKGDGEEAERFRRPWFTTVFHYSQTDEA
jgi:hypothetical protein